MISRRHEHTNEDTGRLNRWRTMIATAVLCLPLAGCGGGSMSDLRSYVQEVLSRPGRRPAELPPIEAYVVYEYKSVGAKDPFEPFYRDVSQGVERGDGATAGSGVQPNTDRNREELESYTLDSLRMMGTLERDEQVWGIVRSPDSVIHRIQVGNYIGHNHGKIIDITEDGIDLIEIIPDGQGGWVERDASLALLN